mgnify:FL=1
MKARITLFLALALLFLSGCGNHTPAATDPETTAQLQTAAPETTAPETTDPPETEGTQSTGPQYGAPIPGYYLVSSVGCDGDVTFYSTADPANGFLKLEEDGTGQMSFGGAEGPLTWDDEAVHWQGQTLPCMSVSYYDAELGRDEVMLVMYFLDTQTSLILRPAEAPTGES